MSDRRARGEALRRLAVRFRSGIDDKRLAAALEDMDRWKIETVDLVEAVERTIKVRDKSTFPQSAEIRRHAIEARQDRLSAAAPISRIEPGARRWTPQDLKDFRRLRAIHFPQNGKGNAQTAGQSTRADSDDDHE